MAKRLIVHIDEVKCDGCGACVPSCVEGALSIVNGKAQLSEDRLCDGLGACLGECPRGALTVEERDADEFDEAAAETHLQQLARESDSSCAREPAACPGSRVLSFAPDAQSAPQAGPSALSQWPVQLTLVPVKAPFFAGADLLVAADCVPFACGSFHQDLLAGRALVVGCPKLDDARRYIDKLGAILQQNDVKSIAVAHMEVPCCYGLGHIVEEAVALSGKHLPVTDITVTVRGDKRESTASRL